MNAIRVPKPSRAAFDKSRPLEKNHLLQAQLRHFREVEKNLGPEQQTGIDVETIATEGEAAEYIRKVTAALHPAGVRTEKVKKAT
jgi:hypothetical protein